MQKGSDGLFPFYEEEETEENAFRTASNTNTNVALLPYVSPHLANINDISEIEESTEIEALVSAQESASSSSLASISAQSLIATANAIEKDPQEGDGVFLYTVRDGDTLSSIAEGHDITINTILWANTIENENAIMPGDEIFILPVSGLKHIVAKGESLKNIANEYDADAEQIIAFNTLPANGDIQEGDEIIIPGGSKEIPQSEPEPTLTTRSYAQLDGGTKTVEKRHDKPNLFPYGWCTWYVAQKKHIPWRGNAGTWLYNAKAMGYKTGTKPKKGAIIVTTDNSYYGHVGIVEKVKGDTVTISEMNYTAWGKTNTRVLSVKDRKIRGYIY